MQNSDTHVPYGIFVKSSVELAWDESVWLAWDEEIGWYDPYAGRTDDLNWDPDGGWYDPLEAFKEFQLKMARLDASEPKPTPWGWVCLQARLLRNDFMMWIRNETYYGRQQDLKRRRDDRKAQLRAYLQTFKERLSGFFGRRSAS